MRRNLAPLMILTAMAVTPAMVSKAYSQEIEVLGTEVPAEAPVVTDAPVVSSAATVYYISLNGLRVRSTPEDTGKTMGLLSLNERVRIVNPELINGKYVQVEVVRTVNKIQPSEKYYVVREYLAEKKVDYKDFTGKYFVVVNVATETLRIYERQCLDNSCPNKMIMESEVVVGEDRDLPKEEKGKGRSILGSYRVTGWAKFYQDPEVHYPAWYKDGSPALPKVGEDLREWMKKKYMPLNAEGKVDARMRGAFGWYAAFTAPNPYAQWTHGTLGWGADKDSYVKQTKKLITNLFSNPRSSGCTRNNNESIAFLRQIIDTGAPMIKIYAKEALLDQSLANYPIASKPWQYILTKKAGEKSDRAEVLQSLKVSSQEVDLFWSAKQAKADLILDPKSPLNQIIEVGTYNLDTQPTVINYTPGEKLNKIERSVGRKGNVYGVKSKDMSNGVYYVDAGFLQGYAHPTAILETSGFEDEVTPPWMNFDLIK